MKLAVLLSKTVTQAEFAAFIGVSEAKVSQMMSEGVLQRGDTALGWLNSYLQRLREQAAGRMSMEGGGLDLVQERAALARSQRIAQDLKNSIARGQYAPIELLADVLANASQAIVDRMEQVPGELKRRCPDLPQAARDAVMEVLASARNEWVRKTEQLIEEDLPEADRPIEDEEPVPGLDDDNLPAA